MTVEFCPNCETPTIHRGACASCGTSFRVGDVTGRARRRQASLTLPSIREVVPHRIDMVMRDAARAKPGCGLKYRRRRGI